MSNDDDARTTGSAGASGNAAILGVCMERELKVNFIICGVEIDEPYDGSLISVVKGEVEYEERRLTNCVCIRYCVPIASDAALSEQAAINRVLLEEIGLFLHSLSLLLARPAQLITYRSRLDDTEVKPELPPRNAPLGLYNLVEMWTRLPTIRIQRYSLLVRSDEWPLLDRLVNEFRRQPVELRRRLELPLRWFAKGSDEMSSPDRLVAFWISFNSLYEGTGRSEQAAIKGYIQKSVVDSHIAERYVQNNERLLLHLSSFQIELGRGSSKRAIAQELGDLLKAEKRDYLTIAKIIALTIYAIRNNLFHGAYDPDSGEDREHIEIAEYLLSRLLREIIAKQMLGYPLPTTKFVSQEKMGSW